MFRSRPFLCNYHHLQISPNIFISSLSSNKMLLNEYNNNNNNSSLITKNNLIHYHSQRGRRFILNTRKHRKKRIAKGVAINRVWDNIKEHELVPQNFDNVEKINDIPEIKHKNELKKAYREDQGFSPLKVSQLDACYDQGKGEEWFNKKMETLDRYQSSRRKWKHYLLSTSLSHKCINRILNKLPNNQAPLTKFWNKATLDWLYKNRSLLHEYGMHTRHIKHYFRIYNNNNIYQNWPASNEIDQFIQKRFNVNNDNHNDSKQQQKMPSDRFFTKHMQKKHRSYR